MSCLVIASAVNDHRPDNSSTENLVIIEVQTGKYFGEDYMERLEDKYGQA